MTTTSMIPEGGLEELLLKHYDSITIKDGHCRCESPRMKGWPVVSKGDWCGKFMVDVVYEGTDAWSCRACRFFSQHPPAREENTVPPYLPDGSEGALIDHPDVDRKAEG